MRQSRLIDVAVVALLVRLEPAQDTSSEVPACIVMSLAPDDSVPLTMANDTSNARVVRMAKNVARRFSRSTRIVVRSDPTTRRSRIVFGGGYNRCLHRPRDTHYLDNLAAIQTWVRAYPILRAPASVVALMHAIDSSSILR